jgi:hypothetical protein
MSLTQLGIPDRNAGQRTHHPVSRTATSALFSAMRKSGTFTKRRFIADCGLHAARRPSKHKPKITSHQQTAQLGSRLKPIQFLRIGVKIAPCWICAFDERDLPVAAPPLHEVLAP